METKINVEPIKLKVKQSIENSLSQIKETNKKDYNRILNEFMIEERRTKVKNMKKTKIETYISDWGSKTTRYSEERKERMDQKISNFSEKLRQKSGSNQKHIDELKEEKQLMVKLKKKIEEDNTKKIRDKIRRHKIKIEDERQNLQDSLDEKSFEYTRRLDEISGKRHNKIVKELERSKERYERCKSYIEEKEKDFKSLKENQKLKQFEDFYFFFEQQKSLKKEIYENQKNKQEAHQYLVKQRISELDSKNKETMNKINNIYRNYKNTVRGREAEFEMKRHLFDKKLQDVKVRREGAIKELEKKNFDTLSKQLEWIENSHRNNESSIIKASKLK